MAFDEHDSQLQHGGPDPDDTPSSPPCNPTFAEILDARPSRRTVLVGGAATAVATFLTRPLAAAAAPASANGRGRGRGRGSGRRSAPLVGFDSIPGDRTDAISLPPGYSSTVLIPWGEPIVPGGPAWQPDASNSAAEQAEQIGQGHDGMHFFPIGSSSTHGLLVVNHEYTIDSQLFPDGTAAWDEEKTDKSQNAHGVSVVEVRASSPGSWAVVPSRYARRVTAQTEMSVSGPAAGHRLLRTSYDQSGTRLHGTANNCSHGYTPWGTYLACEENANGYFYRTGTTETPEQAELLDRYGYSAFGFGYQWATTDARFRTGDEPNEPNRFHWITEIDVFDPDATPVKRTAMGRFKHEGAIVTEGRGRRVVVYSGDDERGDYIYKYVGNRNWKSQLARGISPLDDGVLYAAVFEPGSNDTDGRGTGRWEPLRLDNPKLAGRFADQGELLVKTRLAADLVGATRMDRPEWIAVHPDSNDVYCSLTNNRNRGVAPDQPVDDPNPVPRNPDGHIIRWAERNGDNAATTFEWDIFLIAGENPIDPNGDVEISDVGFGSPDGLWFDPDGRLWIQTDGGQPIDSNDQMLAADPSTGELRRFLVGVPECEVTGVITTPDQRTMFVNIQHPGDDGGSTWPQTDGADRPRPATVVVTKDDGGIIGT